MGDYKALQDLLNERVVKPADLKRKNEQVEKHRR
jgi:hypothetical protein